MSKEYESYNQRCPLCGERYHKDNHKSRHHIFPRSMYNIKITVEICHRCHNEFHRKNVFSKDNHWTMIECVKRFYMFCYIKNKDMNEAYPCVFKEIMLS